MIFVFAFMWQIFPARATPDHFIIRSRIHWCIVVSHGIAIDHNCNDRIWLMGIFGKKFHGRNNARRLHHGKKDNWN